MELLRGETKAILFTMVDSAGTPQNIDTTYSQIVVWLYAKASQGFEVVKKYAWNALADHDTVDFVKANQSTNPGEFTINVQESITVGAPLGDFYFEVKRKAPNASFTDGYIETDIISTDDTGNKLVFVDNRTRRLNI